MFVSANLCSGKVREVGVEEREREYITVVLRGSSIVSYDILIKK